MPSMELRYLTVYEEDAPPKKPAKPTISAITATGATATCTPPRTKWIKMEVQYRKAGGSWFQVVNIINNWNRYVMTSLASDSDYEIQVRFKNDFGFGPWSDSATFHTLAA